MCMVEAHALSKLYIAIVLSYSTDVTTRHAYKLALFQDTWQEMEKLVDDGLVKSIGISNFSCKKIDALLEYARIKPVAVQVEVHPYFRNQKLMDHCKAKVRFQKHEFVCYLQDVCYLPLERRHQQAICSKGTVPCVED